MEKFKRSVPKGIRYMSEWTDFEIPDHPHIMNKIMTGCGFTEYFLRPNPKYPRVILISPRRVLLENKEEQHNNPKADTPEEVERLKREKGPIYYARNDLEVDKGYDIDMTQETTKCVEEDKDPKEQKNEEVKERIKIFKERIDKYIENCWMDNNRDVRIIVTYDSFRHVREALGDRIYEYQIVVDEFHTLLPDSIFKSDTELELLHHLRDLRRVCFLSATPMLDKYLERLSDFKNLPYYELDWEDEDPDRAIHPQINRKQCISIVKAAKEIIDPYLEGKFERVSWRDEFGIIHEILSTELVTYCNSVRNICDIIKKCKLIPEQCNIICAKTKDNEKKIKEAFTAVLKNLGMDSKEIRKRLIEAAEENKKDKDDERDKGTLIGSVPQKGQLNKMFTFCTRTVFLGADFYSKCARTLILSDANIKCLTIDISTDFLQIIGRQRDEENPWRYDIIFRFKTNFKDMSEEEFEEEMRLKEETTESLLRTYDRALDSDKCAFVNNLRFVAQTKKYKDDYVAVNKHAGSTPLPCKNELVMVAERRAFDLQSKEYFDCMTVLGQLEKHCGLEIKNDVVANFYKTFESKTTGLEKMKYLYEFLDKEEMQVFMEEILWIIPLTYRNYLTVLGLRRIKSLGYQMDKLEKEYQIQLQNQLVSKSDLIYNLQKRFKEGERYLNVDIKPQLQRIYDDMDLKKTAKATDLKEWFDIKRVNITNPETKKREPGFEIIKLKSKENHDNNTNLEHTF